MLLACSRCRRQYDSGRRPPGSKVRCYCGNLIPVPEPRVLDAPAQRCTSCGARLRDGARRCDYCSSEVTLGERGWGEACPVCFARLPRGAAFCGSCGTRIEPHALRRSEGAETCPRCASPLTVCEVPGAAFMECTRCGGVWLEEALFEEAVQDRERTGAIASFFAAPRAEDARARQAEITGGTTEAIRYLECPACGKIMNRQNFARASGVIVDHCKEHGYWLDPNEMEAILAFVESGGLERARKLEVEKEKGELERLRFRNATTSLAASPLDAGPGGGLRIRTSGDLGRSLVGVLAAFLDALTD